ncbi:COX15/CtaA family protein [Flavobacteriales bacterium]|nr:COX15/CtaA family protein [Flavobacteriales bacterium]
MNGDRSIIIWLLSGCFLIFTMVIIGGITRLTHSGLSMVDWRLFMGAIPPLNDIQWQETFNLYKKSPEFLKVNYNFTLHEFKSIFFWEYLHRLIGRLLGIVFILPFLYFLLKKKLTPKLKIQTTILLIMGAMQGAIGWWMVKSGLVNKPDVSHFRLAVHLITAFLTCAYAFWIALPLMFIKKRTGHLKLFKLNVSFLIIVIIQIIYGAFVAGLNAGYGFNTWPLMNGEWIPEAVYSLKPFWKNFTEAPYGVQFIHRVLAFVIVGLMFFIWDYSRKAQLNIIQKKALTIQLLIVILQLILGVLTLVLIVPISLALAHQAVAFFLLITITYTLFIFKAS